MADRNDPVSTMTDTQKRALPEVLDMVDEYESSGQFLQEELQNALSGGKTKEPSTAMKARSSSPLDRPALHRRMSMELDEIKGGSSAMSSTVARRNGATAPDPSCMSPLVNTHPKAAGARARPTPDPNNPWYTKKLSTKDTVHHLFHILKSVRSSVKKWNLEFAPENFRAFLRKARTNWSIANSELRQMSNGLKEMHEFLVCGPKEWEISTALSTKFFEDLRDVVADTMAHVVALVRIDGCAWLDEQVRTPLIHIDRQLYELLKERIEYKDRCWQGLQAAKKLPYKINDMKMGGT